MALTVAPMVAGTISAGDLPFILGNLHSDYVLTAASGLLVSTNSTTSTAVSIATGTACVYGAQVYESGTGSLNVATSATAYVYVILTLNANNKPTAVTYTTNATDAMTVSGFYSFRFAKVVSTTNVSVISDLRPQTAFNSQENAIDIIGGIL